MTEKLEQLWASLREVDKSYFSYPIDLADYRLDDRGAIVKKSEYGSKTHFGWNIDHLFPISKGGDNNIRNLEILHWKNNEDKGDDFPKFHWSISMNKNSDSIENVEREGLTLTFRQSVLESLSDLYPAILKYRVCEIDNILK